MTPGSALQHGSILLGKYRIESVLGRGGMGIVVRARHLALDELVAIKLLRDDVAIDGETIARFVREAQAAVKLKSEHVARITDVGTFDDGKPYMVMEFLEGQDLGDLIRERGRLHPSLAIDLVIQTCDALAEAHALGIVHRDIKPTNLFLTSRPDGMMLLKVLDFGISKATTGVDLSLTQTASMLGTPAYMSPEQMRSARRVDARTDIWSLGSVLYEALEGHLPFRAESFSEMCVMVAVDPPEPMQHAPAPLAAIVARCLAKTPDQRYQNVAELGRDLAAHAREPARAMLLVDRMARTLGRSLHITANRQTPPGTYTPLPVPAVVTPPPIAPAALGLDTATTIDAAAPLSLSEMRVKPRRRAIWAVLAALVSVGIAVAVIQMTRDDTIIDSAPIKPSTGSAIQPAVAPGSGAAPVVTGSATEKADPAIVGSAAPPAGSAAEPHPAPPEPVQRAGSSAAPRPTPPRPAPPSRPRPRPPVRDPDPFSNPHGPGHGPAPAPPDPPKPPEPAGSGSSKPDCKDPFSSRTGC